MAWARPGQQEAPRTSRRRDRQGYARPSPSPSPWGAVAVDPVECGVQIGESGPRLPGGFTDQMGCQGRKFFQADEIIDADQCGAGLAVIADHHGNVAAPEPRRLIRLDVLGPTSVVAPTTSSDKPCSDSSAMRWYFAV